MKRILFVDDEPNVLHGLQRMLRPMRDQWDMHFVGGAIAALELLERQGVDVVVTDMRMPGMDGVALLERLVERHPRIVRIVLSRHAERESLMRAAAVAHQYLSKPCEPDVLRSRITQAFALSTLLSDARLNELASRLKTLPTVSTVYREVLAELDSPDASAARVAAVIERDLSMTAKLLQLANSTFFGSAEQVSTCRHAVELLGLPIGQRDPVKVGAQILRVAIEFDAGMCAGLSPADALSRLRLRPGQYDPLFVEALSDVSIPQVAYVPRRVTVHDLRSGMVLDQDVRNESGLLLIARGHEVTLPLLIRLKSLVTTGAIGGQLRVLARAES